MARLLCIGGVLDGQWVNIKDDGPGYLEAAAPNIGAKATEPTYTTQRYYKRRLWITDGHGGAEGLECMALYGLSNNTVIRMLMKGYRGSG